MIVDIPFIDAFAIVFAVLNVCMAITEYAAIKMDPSTVRGRVLQRLLLCRLPAVALISLMILLVTLGSIFTNPLPASDFHLIWLVDGGYDEREGLYLYQGSTKEWESGQSIGVFAPSPIPEKWVDREEKCLMYLSKYHEFVRIVPATDSFIPKQGELEPKTEDFPTAWCLDWPRDEASPVRITRVRE